MTACRRPAILGTRAVMGYAAVAFALLKTLVLLHAKAMATNVGSHFYREVTLKP